MQNNQNRPMDRNAQPGSQRPSTAQDKNRKAQSQKGQRPADAHSKQYGSSSASRANDYRQGK